MPFVSSPAAETSGLIPLVHADDCGLSAGITEGILRCHDDGWLRGTSVVATGADWEQAVAALKQRPRLRVALHLNLFEGCPLSDPSEVDLLVDNSGRFNRSFVALCASGLGRGRRLTDQVRLEVRRQIARFWDAFADRGPIAIDGHVHYHVIPLVLAQVLALCSEYPVGAVRLPREPLYWPLTSGSPRPPLVNVTKNLVLRQLCHWAAPVVRARSLQTTAACVGVLASGRMTVADIRAALDHLRRRRTRGTVEIIFHPGRARPEEARLWSGRPELAEVYLSPARDRESEVLRSEELGELLRRYPAPDAV